MGKITKQSRIVPAAINIQGKTSWDSRLPIVSSVPNNTNAIGAPVLALQDLPNSVHSFMECPICKHLESNSSKYFQLHDLDKTHTCFFCKKARAIKLWRCTCNALWHTCAVHSRVESRKRSLHEGSNTATGKPSSKPRGASTKIALSATAPYRAILDGDLKRGAKRKAGEVLCDIDLGPCQPKPPPVLHLGPVLRKRFYGY